MVLKAGTCPCALRGEMQCSSPTRSTSNRGQHRFPAQNSRTRLTDTIRHTQRTSRLDTATHILHLGLGLSRSLRIYPLEQLPGKHLEARGDPLPRELLQRLDRARHGHLDLELALSKPEREELGDLVGVRGLGNDVLAGDSQSDGAEGDEAGDVRRGEEDAAASAGCNMAVQTSSIDVECDKNGQSERRGPVGFAAE